MCTNVYVVMYRDPRTNVHVVVHLYVLIHLYVYVVMYGEPKHACSYRYCQKSDMVSDKKSCGFLNSANTKSS